MILASLQLSNANFAEAVLALAALVCGVGFLFGQKWALFGTYITLMLAILVYFAQIWFEPIITGDGSHIVPNVLKMIVAILLLTYIGRARIEYRFS
jgi:hypothetical protein